MTLEDVVGKTVRDILPDDTADILVIQDQEMLDSRSPIEFEYEAPDASGADRNLLGIIFPVFGSTGDIIGIGSVNLDITKDKARNEAEFFSKMAVSGASV